jgi:hypothetical protein
MSLRINSDFNGVTDPDAGAYIAAVEAADGQLLEFGVGKAINNFVVGCKQDRIWGAIKASCILAGARTLAGALQPLAGTAPTNFNFVSGDYNRKTGLVGDGSTKHLSSNQTYAQLMTQNNGHFSVYVSQDSTTLNKVYIGDYEKGGLARDGASRVCAHVNSNIFSFGTSFTTSLTGLLAVRRNASDAQVHRFNGVEATISTASAAVTTNTVLVFQASHAAGNFRSTARLAFYSIGESLDLALLDARVTALITAFGVAIP